MLSGRTRLQWLFAKGSMDARHLDWHSLRAADAADGGPPALWRDRDPRCSLTGNYEHKVRAETLRWKLNPGEVLRYSLEERSHRN